MGGSKFCQCVKKKETIYYILYKEVSWSYSTMKVTMLFPEIIGCQFKKSLPGIRYFYWVVGQGHSTDYY